MLSKTGTVTITDNQTIITEFVFSDASLHDAQVEAIEWALGKLHDSYVAAGTSYGTQTIWVGCEDSASATGGWVVGKIDTEIANSLAGSYYIEYVGK